jgi:hypothetical protein
MEPPTGLQGSQRDERLCQDFKIRQRTSAYMLDMPAQHVFLNYIAIY